jgi:hypothetical protein
VDPLSEPGHTDLTANVDFSYIKEALSDLGSSFSHALLAYLLNLNRCHSDLSWSYRSGRVSKLARSVTEIKRFDGTRERRKEG